MIIENIVCMIVGILIGYAGMYVAGYKPDAVIAKLKEKHKTEVKELIRLIRDQEKIFNRAFYSEEKEIRHQKYKRCLAMAEWCDAEADVADADGDYDDMRWYQKWHTRWLEYAEKFN